MSEANSFNCPKCGSSLMTNGMAEVKCPYCGSTVIVPEELRDLVPYQGDDQVSAKDDGPNQKHEPAGYPRAGCETEDR